MCAEGVLWAVAAGFLTKAERTSRELCSGCLARVLKGCSRRSILAAQVELFRMLLSRPAWQQQLLQ